MTNPNDPRRDDKEMNRGSGPKVPGTPGAPSTQPATQPTKKPGESQGDRDLGGQGGHKRQDDPSKTGSDRDMGGQSGGQKRNDDPSKTGSDRDLGGSQQPNRDQSGSNRPSNVPARKDDRTDPSRSDSSRSDSSKSDPETDRLARGGADIPEESEESGREQGKNDAQRTNPNDPTKRNDDWKSQSRS